MHYKALAKIAIHYPNGKVLESHLPSWYGEVAFPDYEKAMQSMQLADYMSQGEIAHLDIETENQITGQRDQIGLVRDTASERVEVHLLWRIVEPITDHEWQVHRFMARGADHHRDRAPFLARDTYPK